jgi:hypothetical protein
VRGVRSSSTWRASVKVETSPAAGAVPIADGMSVPAPGASRYTFAVA